MQDYWKAIENYDKFIESNPVDDEVIKAYTIVTCDVLENIKNREDGLKISAKTKNIINKYVHEKTQGGYFWDLEKYASDNKVNIPAIDCGYEIYRAEAPYLFESYMFYMEKNRKVEKRFYKPRRCTLRTVVNDLQSLEDDVIDTYGLSLPARTGKSTICVFFLSWVGYKKPDSHSAMGGHSGQLAKRFFKGYDNIVETPEYAFAELFQRLHPGLKVLESKSSDPGEFTINLGEPDEFNTLSCRGIDGTWTGAIDISSDGYLYVDDLVRDREHSMSPSRMENTYQEYQNKMLDRMNDGAKKLLVGTLWSVFDPLERERKQNEDNPRALFRKIPALNENDESNFQYEIKGFSTQYYINMRERLDKAEWSAKYMQAPFVREGLIFPIEELQFFDGTIPDEACKTIALCDPAFGGGDSLSMPIGKVFDDITYIVGWIHDNRSPEYTVPKVVDAIDKHGITLLWIEKNSGGQLVAEKIQKEMESRGIIHCKIELFSAPVKMHKEEKITGHSDYVKRNFKFLLPKAKEVQVDDLEIYYADKDYRKAIDEMTTWSAESKGKRVHDDSPDAIATFAMKLNNKVRKVATVSSSWI